MAGRKGEKHWRDALMIAVNDIRAGDDGEPKKALRLIAEKAVELAIAGDIQAIKEIGDRMDGKARQETETTVNAGDGLGDLLASVASHGKRLGQD